MPGYPLPSYNSPPNIQSDAAYTGISCSSGLSSYYGPTNFYGPVTMDSTTAVTIIGTLTVDTIRVNGTLTGSQLTSVGGIFAVGSISAAQLSSSVSIYSSGLVTGLGHTYSTKVDYTQLTNATTAVPIAVNAGSVTTVSLTTASAATTVFTLTGSNILGTSRFILTPIAYSGAPFTNGVPIVQATAVVPGTATITIANYGANALLGTVTFGYIIV